MFNIQSPSFLRRVLCLDAFTCVTTGFLMLLGARFLAPLLGLPAALLQAAGFALLPIAAFIAYAGTRPLLLRRMVWMIIAGNALWVLGSIALLTSGWVAPTMPGQMFIAMQAIAVAVLAELEYFGVRRSSMSLA
ncbi:MAG: hypothetical protein A3I66_20990 [Burkholderiales bacterium RIFCSPLOWO2_02_FULL_57_36]|nr:MAG: hypothetical protein A3I66_20990 [Burkholderiales bacterium RIFCSPLOWO2_02_FULL_57_36]